MRQIFGQSRRRPQVAPVAPVARVVAGRRHPGGATEWPRAFISSFHLHPPLREMKRPPPRVCDASSQSDKTTSVQTGPLPPRSISGKRGRRGNSCHRPEAPRAPPPAKARPHDSLHCTPRHTPTPPCTTPHLVSFNPPTPTPPPLTP